MSFKERRDFCVPPHLKIVSNTHICYSWLFIFHFVLPHTNSKIQSWVFIGGTDAGAETPILWPPVVKEWFIWKDPDAAKVCRREKKGTTRIMRWLLTQWTWVWNNSGSWWWTVRPGMLQPMGSQWVRHDWATELNWTELLLWVAPNSVY